MNAPGAFLQNACDHWGWVLARGILAVLLGVWAFVWPGLTLAVLVIVWGAYALADGIASIVTAVRMRDEGAPFWSLVVVGIAGIAAGIATFLMPGITALVLVLVMGSWAVIIGVLQVIAAIRLRKVIEGEFWMGLSGALSILFGGYVLMAPGAGALALTWLIGIYAILFGVLLIGLSLQLRSLKARLGDHLPAYGRS